MRISDWSSDVCSSDLASELQQCEPTYSLLALNDTAFLGDASLCALILQFHGRGSVRPVVFDNLRRHADAIVLDHDPGVRVGAKIGIETFNANLDPNGISVLGVLNQLDKRHALLLHHLVAKPRTETGERA